MISTWKAGNSTFNPTVPSEMIDDGIYRLSKVFHVLAKATILLSIHTESMSLINYDLHCVHMLLNPMCSIHYFAQRMWVYVWTNHTGGGWGLAEVSDWTKSNWGVIRPWRRLGLSWNETLLPPTVSSVTVAPMKTRQVRWLFLFDQILEILRLLFDLSGKVANLLNMKQIFNHWFFFSNWQWQTSTGVYKEYTVA